MEDLQRQARVMEEELESWNKELTLARKKFYVLNYYTTRQLLVLRSELGRLKSSGPQHSSWGQVMALLESISSQITIAALAKVVQKVVNRSLEVEEHREHEHSPVPAITPAKHLRKSLKEEPLLVPIPPSPQAHQSTSDTKPKKEVQSLPVAGLTRENLNDKQKAHFTDILGYFGYCEMTALKAIEAVPDGDWFDIVNCLEENAGEWEAAFQQFQLHEEGEPEEEHENSEDEHMECESEEEGGLQPINIESSASKYCDAYLKYLSFCAVIVPPQSPRASSSSPEPQARVVVTVRQHIDETNQEVVELLEAEMGTVEECIRAIDLFGSAQIAFDHMMQSQEKEELFQESNIPMWPVLAQTPQPPIKSQQANAGFSQQQNAGFVDIENLRCIKC